MSAITNAQTLQDYLEIAKENSSELKIDNYNYELAKEKVNEVGNNTKTSFNFGYFIQRPETRVGSQVAMGGIRQQFPWFGTKNTEREMINSSADARKYDVELSERDLFYKVKEAYYNLYEKQTITAILLENKQILMTYENMALAALENNKASFSDVSIIRVQKNELHSTIFQNYNDIEALSKNFNRLLQRNIDEMINIKDSLNVTDILIGKATVDEHPSLYKIDQINETLTFEDELIGKENTPTIGVGLDYIIVNEIENVNIVDNGKDIILPTVSLSIPIFNKDYKSKSNQIRIKQDQVISEKINQKRLLEMALEDALLSFNNSVLSVVAAQKNKEEIQHAININLKAYETGVLDYENIVGLQLQKIKYQLMEVEATKMAFIAKATTEYLTN
ncbi:MAG: TolC family protein [Flavobacteriaceae bacterium]